MVNALESGAIREPQRLLHTFLEKYGEKQRHTLIAKGNLKNKFIKGALANAPYKFKYDKILQLNLSTKAVYENRNQNSTV